MQILQSIKKSKLWITEVKGSIKFPVKKYNFMYIQKEIIMYSILCFTDDHMKNYY